MGFFSTLLNNIPVVGDIVSSIIGANAQKSATRDTNETNAQIAAQNNAFNAEQNTLAYNRQIDMWNMQNEYNTPANQVKRLQEAGLSPYLAYSNAAAGGTASSMSPPSAVRAQNYEYQSPMGAIAQLFGNILPSILNIGIANEKLKQERITTDNLPLMLSNRAELLGNQSAGYAANNQFISPLAYSLLDLRNKQSTDYNVNWALKNLQTDYQAMRNKVYEATGFDKEKASIALLRQRIAAMTYDKQIGEARLNMLRQDYQNNLLREGLLRKQSDLMDADYNLKRRDWDIKNQLYDYNEKYGYGGSHDWLRMLMSTGANILQNVANPMQWLKMGVPNINKAYFNSFPNY